VHLQRRRCLNFLHSGLAYLGENFKRIVNNPRLVGQPTHLFFCSIRFIRLESTGQTRCRELASSYVHCDKEGTMVTRPMGCSLGLVGGSAVVQSNTQSTLHGRRMQKIWVCQKAFQGEIYAQRVINGHSSVRSTLVQRAVGEKGTPFSRTRAAVFRPSA
jgi:hypothetical protein